MRCPVNCSSPFRRPVDGFKRDALGLAIHDVVHRVLRQATDFGEGVR